MLDRVGNLRQVYLDVAEENRALEQLAHAEERDGRFFAEIVPGVTPFWHVVITEPRAEHEAMDYLAARGFGVFLPTFERKTKLGIKVCCVLFPGYVFLFVWDAHRHLQRLQACPGVMRLMYDGNEPAVVPDAQIHRIQALETGLRTGIWKRPRRKSTGDLSAYKGIDRLDDKGRISALHKALGLAS